MKKIIFILIISFAYLFGYAQDAGTKPAESEVSELYVFIKDLKANASNLSASNHSKYINFPFVLMEGVYDYQSVTSWDKLNAQIKLNIQKFFNKIPDNLKLDTKYQYEGYFLEMKKDKLGGLNEYRISIEYDDEDLTCEEIFFKKVNNKFIVSGYSIFSWLDYDYY